MVKFTIDDKSGFTHIVGEGLSQLIHVLKNHEQDYVQDADSIKSSIYANNDLTVVLGVQQPVAFGFSVLPIINFVAKTVDYYMFPDNRLKYTLSVDKELEESILDFSVEGILVDTIYYGTDSDKIFYDDGEVIKDHLFDQSILYTKDKYGSHPVFEFDPETHGETFASVAHKTEEELTLLQEVFRKGVKEKISKELETRLANEGYVNGFVGGEHE